VFENMKIKRVIKRICALGTGVTMLGATAMGAMAADLSEYPSMFVKDGTFNGLIVVGESADTVDSIAAIDIASNMKVRSGTATTTAVSGDSWLVGTSAKKFELANSNVTSSSIVGETFRDMLTVVGDDELDALADGKWTTNENEYTYQQFLYFDEYGGADLKTSRVVKYVEDDNDDVSDAHLFIKNSQQIGRYVLEFGSTAQSDITDSAGTADTTGTYLDDFENTDISFLGKDYTVVQARRPSATVQNSVKLTLMAGSTRDVLLEGESKSYTVKDKTYDVAVSFIDADEAKFSVNGELTTKLKVGETFVLSDKSEIGVSEILYQDYAGGVHSVTFYVGASKMELRDDGVATSGGAYNMKIGSENIDGTTVVVTGTDDNTTFSISDIQVNMTAQDDYFVAAGEKLSDMIKVAGEEKEVLMNGGFDVEYSGLTTEKTNTIGVRSAGSRRYKLRLFDGDGKQVDLPTAYAESQYNLSMGEETQVNTGRAGQKRLRLNESKVLFKDDYFVVTSGTSTDGSAKSYLLQYKGADRWTKTSPKIQFKNAGNGETLEYSVGTGTTQFTTVATIKIGGNSFIVENYSDTNVDDFQVRVDLGGNAAVSNVNGAKVNFVDFYGSEWAFSTNNSMVPAQDCADRADINELPGSDTGCEGNVSNPDIFMWTMTTPNADDYDNLMPANGISTGSVAWNITATTDPELRLSTAGELSLLTPEGESEISYGYTSMGAKVTFREPASDPDELEIEYPEKQRLPQVYFTSGATTSKKSASGDLTKVEVGVASKLDSEVTSVTAQNLIVVGGPCVNTVAAELLGNPADCTEGFTAGKARIKLFEHANGNVAMLVAGHSGADTRLAGSLIANRWEELSGMEVEVEGTTYSDATISAPTVVETTE